MSRARGEPARERRPGRELATPRCEAAVNLLRTQDVVFGEIQALLKQHGLSHAQYNVLRILRGAGDAGHSCQAVRERLVARLPDVTRLVDRLLEAGLVARERSRADRRVVVVRITTAGRALVDALDEPIVALHEAQFGGLGDREVATLNRLLVKARQRPDTPRDRPQARPSTRTAKPSSRDRATISPKTSP